MGLHQTKKILHNKRNNQHSEKATYEMGKNIFNDFRITRSTIHYQKHLGLVVFQYSYFSNL